MSRSSLARVTWTLVLAAVLLVPTVHAAAQQSGGQQEQERQNIEEVVVVTASRTQELLLEAPTSISVIDSADIALSPAQNYADLLRGVPGLNVVQTSARDMNMSSRSTTGTLDASQLVLIDGRSVYQDFFGFVAWDLLPLDFSQIEQIEVIRGPASAVWGANAMTGVVNIITKSPFSMGNAFRLRAGGGERGTGFGSLTYSGVRDKLAYRFTAGYMSQDAWDRPAPANGIPRDGFPNQGTKQPKIDIRIDGNVSDEVSWGLSGGFAGTGGTIHTGIGPFSIKDDTTFWYARGDYNWKNLNVTAYANILDGDATNLLNGLPFLFESETYHFQVNNTSSFGRHSATYGANYRTINFDLSIAPGEDKRSEGGGFAALDLNLTDHIAVAAGARLDTFSTIDGSVFSPRAALLIRPAGTSNHVIRASFGRAYRAPSLINNFLDVTIFNAVVIPGLGQFVFPSGVFGNAELTEERLDQIELGYRGAAMDGKFSWDLSVYRTSNKDSIDFYTSGVYTAFNPPPNWPLPAFFLPPFGPVLLPSTFSYRNIGEIVNKGFEAGIKIEPAARNTMFVNYSYQENPEVTGIDASEIGVPSKHKFNVAWNGYSGPLYYGASVNYVGDAYWADVLDSRFFGTTESYTTLDASLGYMFLDGRAEASVRATNLTDKAVLQHIFGDIIGRRVLAEFSLTVQ